MFDYLIIGQKLIIGGLLRLPKLGNAIKRGTLLPRIGIERALSRLHSRFYNTVAPLSAVAYATKEPLPFENRFGGEKKQLSVNGEGWAKDVFDCAWLHVTGQIPAGLNAEDVIFLVDTAGEGLIYDKKNGRAVQGVTCWASQYDYRLGAPLKKVVINDNLSDQNGAVEFFIDCAANDLFGKYHYQSVLQELSVATVNKEIRALYYDIETLISVYDFNEKSGYTDGVFKAVSAVCKKIKRSVTEAQAAQFRALIAPYLAEKNDGGHTFTYSAIGHSHLDLGWLWPIRETKRKGARTFTNQLLNISRYPDYKFGASQAQLYKWIKELYPDIYARVKTAHAAGKWEIQGATWVEPDSNLVGGESLIRQFYYGKRFFKQEFDEDMKILWLPDSFGYSGCIPQIMKLADTPYFLTQKMSWNTVNEFPYHTFRWAGIDGSEVLAHMLPENTYNSPVFGGTLRFGEKNYKERNISDLSMSLFGIGDGGGGPGFEHIERAERFKDLKGMPKYNIEKALPFFDRLESLGGAQNPYPSYKGELYLERHQATSTTQAKVKYYNRKCEILLKNYEAVAALGLARGLALPVPLAELDEIWEEVLLYQFHDILPGSCIDRVYEENIPRYEGIFNRLNAATAAVLQSLTSGVCIANLNPFAYCGAFERGGKYFRLKAAPYSLTPVKTLSEITSFAAKSGDNFIENDRVRVVFKNGFMSSVFDRALNKEIVRRGERFNLFSMYTDKGDAWDIKPKNYFNKAKKERTVLLSFQTKTEGAKAVASVKYRVGKTVISQEISILDGSPLITFDTRIDYRAKKAMLRVALPVSVKTDTCNFNIQFGHIGRKTTENDSYDRAQFEVSGQKFVDMSDGGWGVSVLNDCKYGFRCKNGVIDIDMLRNPRGGPSHNVDQGENRVVYAVYPHAGALSADTYKEAYFLNNPLLVTEGANPESAAGIDGGAGGAFLSTDNPAVIAENVKIPADGEGLIVRFYNCTDTAQTAKIALKGLAPAEVVNILERTLQEQTSSEITLKPFELINIRFK